MSDLNEKLHAKIDARRHRPIEGSHPYVFLDGIVMKRSWAGETRNVSLPVAIGVTTDGYRETLGIMQGPEDVRAGAVSLGQDLRLTVGFWTRLGIGSRAR